jgi:hypothetical protein
MPQILDFLFDDENERKISANGLSVRRVEQLMENPYLLVPNRRDRRAPFLIIGRDNGGACIAVPVEETHEQSLWRPVTAWPCKDKEANLLRERGI